GVLHSAVTDRDSAPQPTNRPSKVDSSRPITYAEGGTVHYGDQDVTLPARIVELDLTDDGVMVRTADNRVWFTDGGAANEISTIGESGWPDESAGGDVLWGSYVGRMVSGNSGSEVAWFEFPKPRSPEVVVYDTASGQVVYRDRHPVDLPYTGVTSGLYSVDDEAVYGFTDLTYGEALRPTWRIDFATGAFKPMDGPKPYQAMLRNRGLARTLLISDRTDDPADFVPFDGVMEFSVVGTRVTAAGKEPHFVKDGLTGKDFEFTAPPGYAETRSLWLVQWLDDDTVVFHAKQRDGVDLLECHVTTSDCKLSVQAPADAVVPEIG
ncbi:MAG: hypothetical protein WAK18_00350, partial [Nocardioidaceae bacterium]